jgi:hypothetical protein
VTHQSASGVQVATAVRQLRLEEIQFGPAESRVPGEPVEAVFGVGADKVIEYEQMPSSQRLGSLLTADAPRSCPGIGGDIERGEIGVGETDPRVRQPQKATQHVGQRGFPLGGGALTSACPAVLRFPADQLRRGSLGEADEAVPVEQRAPQQPHDLGDHEPRGFDRVHTAEVVRIAGLARQINERFDRGCRGFGLGIAQRTLRVGGQPLEGEPPPWALLGETLRSPAR